VSLAPHRNDSLTASRRESTSHFGLVFVYSWQLQIAPRGSTCVSPFRLCRPGASLLHLGDENPYESSQGLLTKFPVYWSMQKEARFVSSISS
jgi:hypothetical protein